MANPLVLIRRLPRVARVLIVGSLVNKIGTFIVPYLTLVLCRDFRLSIRMVGLLVLGYGVGSLASTLSGGHLTDRLGRRLTLLISLLGSGVLAMALGCVTDARIFIPLLVLFGFLADLYRPASLAIIGDVLPSHQRAIGYAALRMAINLGFACGMALGGVLAHWSWRLLFVGDGLTTTLFGAIVWWAVPETRPAAEAGDVDKAHAPNGIALWRDRTFAALIFSAFVFKLVFYCAFTVLPLSITVWAGYSTILYGVFVGINGLLVALFEVYLVDRLKHLRRLR
ncbi:MAG: MFS transporter, partial [Vicinamibacteria bacterium]|nr:MFS transporter [Vicinamibacteria bacterium]